MMPRDIEAIAIHVLGIGAGLAMAALYYEGVVSRLRNRLTALEYELYRAFEKARRP